MDVPEVDSDLHNALCELVRSLLRDSPANVMGSSEFSTEFNAGQVMGMERAGARLLGILMAYGIADLVNPCTLDFRSNFDS
jgi:hypothetical protein